MSKHEIGAGDVVIELDGHGEVSLKPTLKACMTLTGLPGGLVKIQQRVREMEFGAIKLVIECGIGKTSKDLDDIIYRTGMFNLVGPCIIYLTNIANGGKPIGSDEEEEETDPLVASGSLSQSTTES